MTFLSIVTITYNDDEGLSRTLSSLRDVMRAGGDAVELIVVDGGLRSTTRTLLEAAAPGATLISEKDDGIYDAMNKGLERAVGDHVWFLNGGDEAVADWKDIGSMLRANPNAVILGDYILAGRAIDLPRRSRAPKSMWHALPTSHQAILYPRKQVGTTRYEPRYGIVADYAFTAELFARGVRFQRGGTALARFHLDGVSNEQASLIGKQASTVQRTILRQKSVLRFVSRGRHIASRRFRQLLSGGSA